MMKSFSFMIFLIGCLIVQASWAVPLETQNSDQETNSLENAEDSGPKAQDDLSTPESTSTKTSDDKKKDEGDHKSEEERQIELPLPFLSCLLFETDFACSNTCTLVGSIYGQPITSGVCGEHHDCNCYVSRSASLATYWNLKFDSTKVLQEIRPQNPLYQELLAVFRRPFRTSQETISDLKPYLNEKQLESLKPKDKDAQKLFVADGKLDHSAVKRYADKNLKSLLKSPNRQDFRKILNNALTNSVSDEYVFDRIHDEIRRSGNKHLNETLDQFMKNNNISRSSPSSGSDQENLVDVLDATVVNKFLGPPPREESTRRDFILNLSSSHARMN